MATVHLVRHGRTRWNEAKRTMGRLDEGILPAWEAGAEAVARALAGEGVHRVVSSPQRRARQTAAPLARALATPVEVDERFAELDVGPWEGLLEAEIERDHPELWARWRTEPHRFEMAGRETLDALLGRVGAGLDELAGASGQGRAVAVFTHDAVVRAAVAWALGTTMAVYRHVEVANCSVTTVAIVAGVRRLRRANERSHLAGLDLSGLDRSGLDVAGLDRSGLDVSGLDRSGLDPDR